MQEETKLICLGKKYKVREGIRTKEDKSNQRRVVFFGKQKIESKNLQRQTVKPSLIFSGANVVQSYKKKNARA